jgi:hypothetical protein
MGRERKGGGGVASDRERGGDRVKGEGASKRVGR